MNRSVFGHALVLGAALVSAYMVWTREPEPSADEISLIRYRRGVDTITYDSPKQKVEIQRRRDEVGTYYWVNVSQYEVKKPADKAAATEKPAPKKVATTMAFLGNDTAKEMAETLSRLTALRALGQIAPAKRTELKLDKAERRLALASGTDRRSFVIGESTFGNADFYARDEQDNQVYVLKGQIRQQLENAEFRYIERRLIGLKPADIEKIEIRAGKINKTLIHHGIGRNASAQFWTDSTSDDPKEQYRLWVSKLDRLHIQEFVQDEKALPKLVPVFQLDVHGTGNKRDLVQFLRKDADSDGGSQYYARASRTRVPVKLVRAAADELIRDLDHILSGTDPKPAAAKTAAPAIAAPAKPMHPMAAARAKAEAAAKAAQSAAKPPVSNK